MDRQSLGDRMKRYENQFFSYLLPNSYAVCRIDGKAFHSYTRDLAKPFDDGLIEDMQLTTKYLCENIQGVICGYTQSDEISLIMTDLMSQDSEFFFGGKIQKIVSVTASYATAKFNQLRMLRDSDKNSTRLAVFDSRVFSVPNVTETLNYLRWRQRDAVKNSISMVAQSFYSHKELDGKNSSDKQEMIFQKGKNWNDYPGCQKRGSTIVKRKVVLETDDGDLITHNRWEIETPDLCGDCGGNYYKNLFSEHVY